MLEWHHGCRQHQHFPLHMRTMTMFEARKWASPKKWQHVHNLTRSFKPFNLWDMYSVPYTKTLNKLPSCLTSTIWKSDRYCLLEMINQSKCLFNISLWVHGLRLNQTLILTAHEIQTENSTVKCTYCQNKTISMKEVTDLKASNWVFKKTDVYYNWRHSLQSKRLNSKAFTVTLKSASSVEHEEHGRNLCQKQHGLRRRWQCFHGPSFSVFHWENIQNM